jgi:AcrR family transcriptional regulator
VEHVAGLRERKKAATRQAIAETANRLFLQRGFDAVTVADVAAEAGVSVATVFNYFATKEELFYGQLETFEERLVAAVRDRPADESVLQAFERFILESSRAVAEEGRAERIAAAARVIDASASLQARELQVVAAATESLARLLAAETKARGVEPTVVAAALMGAHRAVVTRTRASARAGASGSALAREVRAETRRAFAQLARGLADYGARRRP